MSPERRMNGEARPLLPQHHRAPPAGARRRSVEPAKALTLGGCLVRGCVQSPLRACTLAANRAPAVTQTRVLQLTGASSNFPAVCSTSSAGSSSAYPAMGTHRAHYIPRKIGDVSATAGVEHLASHTEQHQPLSGDLFSAYSAAHRRERRWARQRWRQQQ